MRILASRKEFISYAVLPQIRPRIAELFMSGFQYVPYFIALVYQAVRLLPAGHPYVNPVNIGRYGVRHVIAEAANNLVISVKNIDQILLFICIMVGLILVLVQLCLLGISVFFQPVMAGTLPQNFLEFFLTPVADRPHDIAGMMMDMVFGVPHPSIAGSGFFESCISTATNCKDMNNQDITDNGLPLTLLGPLSPGANALFPFPMHHALHQLFRLYNTGLLVVAVFIASYFVVTILAETAQTGTPFGKRFNKVWAPIRIVVAFGLLIPFGAGLNSSQYIVLYAAKFGSGFATNGWNLFNRSLTGNYLGQTASLVATPNIPEVRTLLQFFYVARTCYYLELVKNGRLIQPYLVDSPTRQPDPFLLVPAVGLNYDDAVAWADGKTILTLVFGPEPDPEEYGHYKGFVKPICGSVTLTLADPRIPGSGAPPEPGAEELQRYYWELITDYLWYGNAGIAFTGDPDFPQATVERIGPWFPQDPFAPQPTPAFKTGLINDYEEELTDVVEDAIEAQVGSGDWAIPIFMREKGWAGAGIWYNRVAEMNGAMTTAVFNIPEPKEWPSIMEYIRLKKKQHQQLTLVGKTFNPSFAGGKDATHYADEAKVLYEAYQYWEDDDGATTTHSAPTDNIVIDAINLIFGTNGLFNMTKNQDIHPLAQLVGIGRALVESSIRNLGVATIGKILEAFTGPGASGVAASFLMTITTFGLTAGFILYYIVPFLPFIYFFFAIGGWVKGIFEAMVGAPLWALAHIRIDGNGLPGQAAVNGYFLIFEIFLRPILIVFGLLAAISIFSALVAVLNQTFDLVTNNLTGFDAREEAVNPTPGQIAFYRAPVDEFFFTIIYTIIVYLMGMSSFKLIDLIPNNILRWMGQSVATFGDQREDPAQGLVGTATIGAQQTLSKLGGLGGSIGKAAPGK